MKKSNSMMFIVLAGVFVLSVFSVICLYNLLPSKNINSKFLKVADANSARIESFDIDNGILKIYTAGDVKDVCVKSTKSTPKYNSLCWKQVLNNTVSLSIYRDKKYYVWVRDINGNINGFVNIKPQSISD